MKNHTKLLFTLLALFALLFTSCREESDELIEAEEDQVLEANSKVADLMRRTALNDGSKDNILDGTTCFSIKLPVTVNVNGTDMVIDSEEDFITIEEIFNQFENDLDQLSFVFPLIIVLNDFTELVIGNENELANYIENCDDDQDEDEDIECLDFQYPFSVSVFDSASELLETVTFNSDEELYNFINDLDENDVVNVSFPITVVLSDNSEIIIHDLEELENVIEEAIDDCDENDLSATRFSEILVSEDVRVQKFKDNQSNETNNYRDYLFNFADDGTVVITLTSNTGDTFTDGTWIVATRADGGLNATFDFGTEVPLDKLTKIWNVKKILNKRIMLDIKDEGISKDELFFQQLN